MKRTYDSSSRTERRNDQVEILALAKGAKDHKGEVLVEVETDKVNDEIEPPGAGRLDETRAASRLMKVGAVVAVSTRKVRF